MRQTEGGLCAVARHDGYKSRFGLEHERRVGLAVPDGYTIEDRFLGMPKKTNSIARVRYFLSPYLDTRQTAANTVELDVSGVPLATIATTLGGTCIPLRLLGIEISSQFGQKIPGKCIQVEVAADRVRHNKLVTHLRVTQPPAARSAGTEGLERHGV